MKKIILILLLFSGLCRAQTFTTKTPPTSGSVTRGSFGTYQSLYTTSGTVCAVVSNTVTATTSPGTLTGIDTGFVQWTNFNRLSRLFNFYVTKTSGTVAGTAVLQGSMDNVNWHTLTGVATYCTDCIGASATITNTTGTKEYIWSLPPDAPTFPYMQVRAEITNSTSVCTFSGKSANTY